MDGTRFDQWTRGVVAGHHARRTVLRASVGGGLAVLGIVLGIEEAAACRRNGKPCGKGPNGNCCSGTCKKDKCRPTKGAAGCTVNQDTCKANVEEIPCPKKPEAFCVKLDNGKPFCAGTGVCRTCSSNSDCTELSGGIPGKCLKTCAACPETNNRACVFADVADTAVNGTRLRAGFAFR